MANHNHELANLWAAVSQGDSEMLEVQFNLVMDSFNELSITLEEDLEITPDDFLGFRGAGKF